MNWKRLRFSVILLILTAVSIVVYQAYKVKTPDDNYIAIFVCNFGCRNNLLLDLNTNELSIYSGKYNYIGLLVRRKLTTEEVELINEIFHSKEYLGLEKFNMKAVLDAEEIHIQSKIQGQEKRVGHIMPEDKTVRRIIGLYNELTRE